MKCDIIYKKHIYVCKGVKAMNDNSDKDVRFYELLEQLVTAMTDYDIVDISHIESLLIEISSMFRLSKAVTHVYRNPKE